MEGVTFESEVLRIARACGPLDYEGFLELLQYSPDLILESPRATWNGKSPFEPPGRCSTKARMLVDVTMSSKILNAARPLGYYSLSRRPSDIADQTLEVPFWDWLYQHQTSGVWCVEMAACCFLFDWSAIEDWFPTSAGQRFREQLGSFLRALVLTMAPDASIVFRKTSQCPRAAHLSTLAEEFGLKFSEDDRIFRLDWRTPAPLIPESPIGTMRHFSELTTKNLSDWSALLKSIPEETSDAALLCPSAVHKNGKSKPCSLSSQELSI